MTSQSGVIALATHLPPWGRAGQRSCGPDEDVVTLAVAAGSAALDLVPGAKVDLVVLVTRDGAPLDTGVGPVVLAALGLPSDISLTTVLGGAPAALDALASARPGTLLLTADTSGGAASAAALTGAGGAELTQVSRVGRSVPTLVRDAAGVEFDYSDARLQRERGLLLGLEQLSLPGKPLAVAGVSPKDAAAVCEGTPAALPTAGASSALFALADVLRRGEAGLLVSVEQGLLTAVNVQLGEVSLGVRAPEPRALPKRTVSAEADIKMSLPAYDRAFDAKVGLKAGKCGTCGTLALPPRLYCLSCGHQGPTELIALPRRGSVYTTVTVHVPVPGLATPYSLAIVELGDTGVRITVHVTDAVPGAVAIDDLGQLVLRRVAVRSGIPDYGYAFAPDEVSA